MTEPAEDEHGLELVMPFVTVRSAGGPYEDDAYAAGWEMGALDRDLASGDIVHDERTVRVTCLAQADLIAMRHGYSLTVTVREHDKTWAWATFSYKPEEQP